MHSEKCQSQKTQPITCRLPTSTRDVFPSQSRYSVRGKWEALWNILLIGCILNLTVFFQRSTAATWPTMKRSLTKNGLLHQLSIIAKLTYISKGSLIFCTEWQTSCASANNLSLFVIFPVQTTWLLLPLLFSGIPNHNKFTSFSVTCHLCITILKSNPSF